MVRNLAILIFCVQSALFSYSAGAAYCVANGGGDEYIYGVHLGAMDVFGTGSNGYSDYTSVYSQEVTIDSSYTVSVVTAIGGQAGYGYEGDQLGIWIDWNRDDDFTENGEKVYSSYGYGYFEGYITVPSYAVAGNTRMRVRLQFGGTLSPCWGTDYGEVEDYRIIIKSASTNLKVSGHVTLSNGTGLKGVELEAINGTATPTGLKATSDQNGYYEIIIPGPWTGHIKATKAGYAFNWPTNFSNVTTDQTQDFSAYYAYSGGFGTAGSPYLISTAEDMNAIGGHREDWSKQFKMTADIDLSQYAGGKFAIIGNSTNCFQGVFDGDGHAVKNLKIGTAGVSANYLGLFGNVDNATLKNLSLENMEIVTGAGSNYAGGLAGYFYRSSAEKCNVDVVITAGNNSRYLGGITGYKSSGTISTCRSKCSITAGQYAEALGGIAGYNYGYVNSSYAMGSLTAGTNSNHTGGIAGQNYGTIDKSYSTVRPAGSFYKGGIAGYHGAMFGGEVASLISNCVWDTQVSTISSATGGGDEYAQITNTNGKTTAEMKTSQTYTSKAWDFATPVWKICEGTGYPKFAWEKGIAGNFVCPDWVNLADFGVMARKWMTGDVTADIEPAGGDGIVDWHDLMRLSDNWLIQP
jgi:hypothetical protein